MTDKEEAIIKDKILKCINEISSPHSTNVTLVSEHLNIDFNNVWTLSKELEFDGYIKFIDASSKSGKDAILVIEPDGKYFISNNSYLSLYESEKSDNARNNRNATTKTVITIGTAIIFGLSALVLGWLNYIDNKTIQKQNIEIERLEILIDSLKNNQ